MTFIIIKHIVYYLYTFLKHTIFLLFKAPTTTTEEVTTSQLTTTLSAPLVIPNKFETTNADTTEADYSAETEVKRPVDILISVTIE